MQNFLRKRSSKKFFSTLAMLSLVMPGVLLQMPYQQEAKAVGVAAGTVIGNQATASYKDTNNNTYNSTSNFVQTTVASIYGVTLTPDGTIAAPGQQKNATQGAIVYYPYTLTNTGNTADTYAITTSTPAASNSFTPTGIKVYYDVNGNGVVDVGDSQIASGGSTVSIPADGSVKLIVEYQVPANAVSGNVAYVDIQADSVGDTTGTIIDNTNYNKTTVVNDAVVAVTKSVNLASVDPSTSTPTVTNNELVYTLNANNTGNAAANEIIIVDSIPANTTFKVGSQTAPAGVLVEYSDTTTGGATTDWDYVPTGTYDSNVKRIRYTMNATNGGTLPANNNRDLAFTVRVNDGAASGTIPNQADFQYTPSNSGTPVGDNPSDGVNDSSGGTGGDTNTVTTTINKKSAAQISFSSTTMPNTTTAGTENPAYPTATSDRTTIVSAPAGTYVYFRNTVTNNGNASDLFDISLDTAQSVLPAGATVTFHVNGTNPANNPSASAVGYSPLLNSGGGTDPDTGNLAVGASLEIITRVFIPAGTAATTTDQIAVIKAVSTNGGTPVNPSVAGQNLSDTTANIIDEIAAPSVQLYNTGYTEATDINVSNTQSAPNATVSYPLTINNTGGSPDTYNLTGASTSLTGETITFYPVLTNTTLATAATAGATSVTVTSATGLAAGDTIVINGQTLTIASVSGTTVTFSAGQTLNAAAASGVPVVERGTTPITSTGTLAGGASQQVIAVVTPGTTTPGTYSDIVFTATSTNNSTISNSTTDTLVIPQFRDFTLTQDRTGSVPPGGTITYAHTITNTGNTNETFTITIPQAQNGLSYQLLDASGNVVSTTSGSNYTFTTPALVPAETYNFTVKVIAPSNIAANTVSSITVTATETTSGQAKTNTDITTVVDGFIQLNKTATIYSYGTNGLDGTATGAATVKPGEVIEYTITYTNIGSKNATEVKIKDLIPANTTYVAGSLKVGATTKTDTVGDTEAGTGTGFGSADGSQANGVNFFVGTGATGTVGGTVGQGETGTVTFRVRVN